MSIFENYEIFAIYQALNLNKLSNDTRIIEIEMLATFKEKKMMYISYYFLCFFTIYFAHYLKTSLADLGYLLLWCVTYILSNSAVVKNTNFLKYCPQWLFNSNYRYVCRCHCTRWIGYRGVFCKWLGVRVYGLQISNIPSTFPWHMCVFLIVRS